LYEVKESLATAFLAIILALTFLEMFFAGNYCAVSIIAKTLEDILFFLFISNT